jgi:dolichol-phosphate mannosyltransferase
VTRKVILALPAYNEASNLPPLLEQARHVLASAGFDYQVLVVNDGSTDETLQVLDGLRGALPLVIVNHEQNRGLGEAIKTGIRAALKETGSPDDVIVNMDADNTHDPSYIPHMAAKIWGHGYDIVIASRFRSGSRQVGVPFGRKVLSWGARIVFRFFLHLPEVRDYTCGYRAYRASVLCEALDKYGDAIISRQGFACTDELLVHLSTVTKKITEVPFVLRYDKKRGHSKLKLMTTIVETLRMLVGRK